MNTPQSAPEICDVAIVGGGAVGATLALALDRVGFRTLTLDAAPAPAPKRRNEDGRAYTIASACWRMWETLGLADRLRADAEPMFSLQAIADGGRGLLIDEADGDGGPLAYLVENKALTPALDEALAGLKHGQRINDARVYAMTVGPGGITLDSTAGPVKARLAVGCDGANSRIRTLAGMRVHGRAHPASAIAFNVKLERPHNGAARQSFLDTGPLAVLPLAEQRANVIWSLPAELASALMELDDAAFDAELNARAGAFVGMAERIGPRAAFPLKLQIAERMAGERIALAGDAAHVVHPLAGQGLNLGLKDVAALAETLVDARFAGLDVGSLASLAPYERWRRTDVMTTAAATEGLARVFGGPSPVRSIASWGMGLTGRAPALRRLFAAEAGGGLGETPKLLAGEPLA